MTSKKITIQNKTISSGDATFIIAEAGVNHNGDVRIAKKLVREAKICGADCVKFQTFQADRIVTDTSPKAAYQLKTTDPNESQMNMLRKLELPESAYNELIQLCEDVGIIFLSTPYGIEDIDFLDVLGVSAFKVASGQAAEPHFLEHMARKGKPVFLSTGMCTLAEADEAVRIIRDAGNDQIVVFQCTTNYPSALEDVNLRAMQTMASAMDVLAGYSDHTQSLIPATLAVGLGACVIERHFTLDKTLPGPDHANSSDPQEFSQLVRQIREAEKCLGSRIKIPSSAEIQNAEGMRRSIVAKKNIRSGEMLTLDNITLKRPATGLPGKFIKLVLNRRAVKEIDVDTMIDIGMIE